MRSTKSTDPTWHSVRDRQVGPGISLGDALARCGRNRYTRGKSRAIVCDAGARAFRQPALCGDSWICRRADGNRHPPIGEPLQGNCRGFACTRSVAVDGDERRGPYPMTGSKQLQAEAKAPNPEAQIATSPRLTLSAMTTSFGASAPWSREQDCHALRSTDTSGAISFLLAAALDRTGSHGWPQRCWHGCKAGHDSAIHD